MNLIKTFKNKFTEYCSLLKTYKGILLISVVAISVIMLIVFIKGLPAFLPIDDAYICIGFAKNIVEHGEFFSYNQGEISTGITSPLYAVMLAFFYLIVRNWHYSVYTVGIISYIATLVLGMKLSYKIAGYWATLAFVCLFGFSGQMVLFSLFGMEPMLYIAFAFAAFLAFFEKRFFLTGVLCGLGMLCRPEAVFIFFVLGLYMATLWLIAVFKRDWQEVKKTTMSSLFLIAGFILATISWLLLCKHVSGDFFPSTVTKKARTSTPSQIWTYNIDALKMYFQANWENKMIRNNVGITQYVKFRQVIPLTLIAATSLFFLRKKPLFIVPFLYIPVHLLITSIKSAHSGESERYLCLNYALTYLYLAVLFAMIFTKTYKTKIRAYSFKGISLACLIFLSSLLITDYNYHLDIYKMKSKYFYMLDYQIGLWLKANTPPDTRVALFQAGGIKFFSERYIIDGGGVTEHTIWKYIDSGNFSQAMVDRKADYVAAFGADWLKKEGLPMSRRDIFTQIPLRCRGLYRIKKPALKAHVENRQKVKADK
jgi:4-amino-4-deoxy-L-arabinose transferase-like glycosyltransferase